MFSIDLAGPLPTNPHGNKHLVIGVKHLTGWPNVCATSTSKGSEVINFVDEQSILPFGKPAVFVFDNVPCIIFHSSESFMKHNDIK